MFKGALAMGIQKIWPALGKSASKTNHHGKVHVPTSGKKVGVELAGLAFQMAVKVCRAPSKAKAVCEHASGKDLSDPEVVLVIAESVVTEIIRLASCCGTLIVVWEGKFSLKRHESGRRAAGRATKVKKGKWNQALSITACMIELVKRRVIEKLGPASWIDPPGEGEVQLMYMLETRQLDVVLGYSGDSDFAVYSGGHGILVLCPYTSGDIGGRKKHGFKGVSVWGKLIVADLLWTEFTVGGEDTVDLSDWTMTQRAMLGALIGHDYDSEPKPPAEGRATGIKYVGVTKAQTAVTKASAVLSTTPNAPASVVVEIRRLVDTVPTVSTSRAKNGGKIKYVKGDAVRLMKVVVGMRCHPVLAADGTITLVGGYASAYDRPIIDWLVRNGEATLGNFINQYCEKRHKYTDEGARGPCVGDCKIDYATALDEYAKQQVEETEAMVTSPGNPAVALDGRAQPTISLAQVLGYFDAHSKASSDKHLEEGLERAYDSAGSAATKGKVTIAVDKSKRTCCLTMSSAQSQGRLAYKVTGVFQLNSTLGKVTEISTTACQCYRRTANVICRHRGSLLAWMWVNSAKGIAGDPAARANYWKRQARPEGSDGAGKAVRLIAAITDRHSEVRAEDAADLEASRSDLDSDDADGAGPADLGDTPRKKKKRKHNSSMSISRAQNAVINAAFTDHFKLDVAKLRAIGKNWGVPRLAEFEPLPVV